MGILLAVANRKGGVGKSTITTMLAHGFAAIGDQRVLVVDLDAQCNSSLIMIGGENWERARQARKTIADYFDEKIDRRSLRPDYFILNDVSDINAGQGRMSLLCGSIDLEDVENELLHNRARANLEIDAAEQAVLSNLRATLTEFGDAFDVVIFDCPPGISYATRAALGIVHKVIVPFRPDFVSRYAVDRISTLIEGRGRLQDVAAMPKDKRRYIGLVNFWRDGGLQRLNYSAIAELHPVMETRIPEDDGIAQAFDYSGEAQSIDEKYGTGAEIVRLLCKEVVDSIISRYQRHRRMSGDAGGDTLEKAFEAVVAEARRDPGFATRLIMAVLNGMEQQAGTGEAAHDADVFDGYAPNLESAIIQGREAGLRAELLAFSFAQLAKIVKAQRIPNVRPLFNDASGEPANKERIADAMLASVRKRVEARFSAAS